MTAVLPTRPVPVETPTLTVVDSAEEAVRESDLGQWPGCDRDWLESYAPGMFPVTVEDMLRSAAAELVAGPLRQTWAKRGYRVHLVPAQEMTTVDGQPGDYDPIWGEVRESATAGIDVGDVITYAGLLGDYAAAHGIPARPRHMTQPPTTSDPAAQCPCRPTTDTCGCPGTALGRCRCYRSGSAT